MSTITKDQFKTARKVVTGKVRCSYVNVFAPRLNTNSGEMEYSMELMIDKKDTATVNAVKKAIRASEAFKFPKGRPNPKLKEWYDPLQDADEMLAVAADGSEIPYTQKRPETKGCYLLRVKNKEAVPVVDGQRQEVLDKTAFVSGDYARASINAHPFDVGKNAGVTFFLNAVQVVAKGEPLGGGVDAKSEFDDWEEDETEAEAEESWA